MKVSGKESIAKIAAELPGARGVFEAFGLEYSCTGDRSLEDAASAEGIDTESVIAALHRIRHAQPLEAWNDRPLADATRYLDAQHHRFVKDELASVAMRLADFCSAAVPVPPADLLSMRAAFTRLAEVVLPHFRREEQHLFPAIEELERAWVAGEAPPASGEGVAENIRRLTLEHATISAQLKTLRQLRSRLAESNDIGPKCRVILDDITTLEGHLHEYIFLENTTVFPRAIALVREMPRASR
jgi:regulator of cell morphogenesis and NO signaling